MANTLKVYPPVIDMRENPVLQELNPPRIRTLQAMRQGSWDEQEDRSSASRMARRRRSWPRLAGDSRPPARSTPCEDKHRRLQDTTDHELAMISPWKSPPEFPHPPYPNDSASLHGTASLNNSTTSLSNTDPFSVGFQGIGLGLVAVSSHTCYVANYTDTPIPKRHPVQNMAGFRTVTIDNAQSAYPGRVTVPNALNAYTSGTNIGKNLVASELSRGIPMPQKRRQGPWDEEEHRNFLRGVNKCGWGRWKLIAEKYVATRDEYQICSHAQKYQSHYNSSSSSGKTGKKKRRSIHDTSLEDKSGKVLPLPVPPCNKGDDPAIQPPPLLPGDSHGRMPLLLDLLRPLLPEGSLGRMPQLLDPLPPPPLPGDSHGRMPLLLDLSPPVPRSSLGRMPPLLDLLPPPPPPGGGDTDPASILHEQVLEENEETQSSDSFDIGTFLLDSPDEILDQ